MLFKSYILLTYISVRDCRVALNGRCRAVADGPASKARLRGTFNAIVYSQKYMRSFCIALELVE